METRIGRHGTRRCSTSRGDGVAIRGVAGAPRRQANLRPAELQEGSRDVPTYHTRQQGSMGAARRLDFVFASHALVDRLSVRALNTDPDEWGPSDHCRVVMSCKADAASEGRGAVWRLPQMETTISRNRGPSPRLSHGVPPQSVSCYMDFEMRSASRFGLPPLPAER